MSYQPQFTINPALLARVESIAALRERIQGAAVQVPWIPALQKDPRVRNTQSSTAIEGNPLKLEEVRAPGGAAQNVLPCGCAGCALESAPYVERRYRWASKRR